MLFREYTPRLARAVEPKPDVIILEMTPNEHMVSHKAVVTDITDIGYNVTVVNRLPSCFCGDHTHRDRWFA